MPNQKTEYKGQYLTHKIMQQEILNQYKNNYGEQLIKLLADPLVDFTTFDAPGLYNEATGSAITNMLIGDYVHTGTQQQPTLIRASAD